MGSPITIEEITISGFRAFLKEQTIKLHQNKEPKSIAIFSPNAKGKSSFVDAIEYFFSEDGTLEKLGLRNVGDQAGSEALRHVQADDYDIDTKVTISFYDGENNFVDTRSISNHPDTLPPSAKKVVDSRKLDFIIRGHKLRKFVEDSSPRERYEEVSEWFELSTLTDIQANVRQLRIDTEHELNSNEAINERLKDLKSITEDVIKEWNVNNIINWINEKLLSPLDVKLKLTDLNSDDDTYKKIKKSKEEEDKTLGLSVLREMNKNVSDIYKQEPEAEVEYSGTLLSFEEKKHDYEQAKEKKVKIKEKTEKTVFKKIWEEAEVVFKNPNILIDKCPVCDTPIEETAAGSREKIIINLSAEKENLAEYNAALKKYEVSKKLLEETLFNLRSKLEILYSNLEGADLKAESSKVEAFKELLDAWSIDKSLPYVKNFKTFLIELSSNITRKIEDIEKERGENSYSNALSKIESLIELNNKLLSIQNYKNQLRILFEDLEKIDSFLRSEIRDFIKEIIDTLKGDINTLYREVHVETSEAPPIRLELPLDTRTPLLNLLIDFSGNHESVSPSGYLSDSQIRTLALSMRLAAFRLFNRDVPIIILDDVVTSYDVEHRRAVASMLAKYFDDFQIILVTHDKRFFQYLKEIQSPAKWSFKCIVELKPEFGPLFHDHQIPDEIIEEKLSNNESAANDIRQVEEEWLLHICREFGVNIRIRDVLYPYRYERSELAIALHKFLKEKKINVPDIKGIKTPFLVSLQQGNVENFGSHFSDDPNSYDSIGDEKKRWKEFKEFRDLFICLDCGCNHFERPDNLGKPVCEKCSTPFKFKNL